MSNQPQPRQTSQPLAAGKNPFAEVVNPYAAPQELGYYPPQSTNAPPFAGLWRQGKLLVMHKRAPLPDVCLKSNQAATRRLKRSLQWHHPAISLTILAGVLVYIILAVVLTKRATIHIALTEEWFSIRWRRILYAWLVVLVSVALFVAGVAFVERADTPIPACAIIVSCILFLSGLIYGQIAPSLVSPKRMTDDYIWLKGVHPDFLDRLEVWQWNI